MTMEFKVRTWLWLVLALVAVLGGVFTYWYVYGQKSGTATVTTSPTALTSTKKTSPSPTASSSTAGWKTYTNIKYGYSIKIPQDYGELSTFDGSYSSNTISSDGDLINFGNRQVSEKGNSFSIVAGNASIDDQIKEYQEDHDVTITNVKIGKNQDIEAVKIVSNKDELRFKIAYLIANNSNLYDIEDTKKENSIIETVISTFQFTK